jgi:predicted fused transcriptional regulator/phosphomethylpyrimidine kinase
MPSAVSSWSAGTTRGTIDPSAGMSTTLVRLIPTLRSNRIGTLTPARESPTIKEARTALGRIIAQRRSTRSMITPANGDSSTWGSM